MLERIGRVVKMGVAAQRSVAAIDGCQSRNK
jgi:hypothetical protein